MNYLLTCLDPSVPNTFPEYIIKVSLSPRYLSWVAVTLRGRVVTRQLLGTAEIKPKCRSGKMVKCVAKRAGPRRRPRDHQNYGCCCGQPVCWLSKLLSQSLRPGRVLPDPREVASKKLLLAAPSMTECHCWAPRIALLTPVSATACNDRGVSK